MTWRAVAALIVLGAVLPAWSGELIRVPDDVPSLSVAIDEIDDGGVIELAAGTYTAPSSGFIIADEHKSFTVRPVPGASVTLSGSGSRPVLRFINALPDADSTVVFEDLVFADGYSTLNGAAGGVTLEGAAATFVRCLFRDNESQATITGGGGTAVFLDSVAHFTDCEWRDNVAKNEGAGLRVGESSEAYVHRGLFIDNLANPPGHRSSSAGGGLHVTNSVAWLTNSRFEGNQAGYAGGGAYALGSWQSPYTSPRAELVLANCTFEDNHAVRHYSVPPSGPTEGGAIHVEDQTRAVVTSSRFLANSADLGGCVSTYRADVEVVDSVVPRQSGGGDRSGHGLRRLLQGLRRRPPDGHRQLPVGGSHPFGLLRPVPSRIDRDCRPGWRRPVGRRRHLPCLRRRRLLDRRHPGYNRTVAAIDGVVFADCDVDWGGVSQQGLAGAISASLVDLDLSDSLIVACDATGNGSSGGAMRIVFQSDVRVAGTTIAANTAGDFGGAIYASGSGLDLEKLQFFDNEFSPGASEPETESYGAAIFAAPFDGSFGTASDLPVTGRLSSSVLSNNVGMPLFDDDRNPLPINSVRLRRQPVLQHDLRDPHLPPQHRAVEDAVRAQQPGDRAQRRRQGLRQRRAVERAGARVAAGRAEPGPAGDRGR